MGMLLLRHAHALVAMDAARREIPAGGLFARDGVIGAVGPGAGLPCHADDVIDVRDRVVLPGLVNTHGHHHRLAVTGAAPAPPGRAAGGLIGLG